MSITCQLQLAVLKSDRTPYAGVQKHSSRAIAVGRKRPQHGLALAQDVGPLPQVVEDVEGEGCSWNAASAVTVQESRDHSQGADCRWHRLCNRWHANLKLSTQRNIADEQNGTTGHFRSCSPKDMSKQVYFA